MTREEIKEAAAWLRERCYPIPADCPGAACPKHRPSCKLGACHIAVGMCGDLMTGKKSVALVGGGQHRQQRVDRAHGHRRGREPRRGAGHLRVCVRAVARCRELCRRGHGAPDPGVCLPARPDRGSAPGGAGRSRPDAEKRGMGAEDYQVVGTTRGRRRSRTQCPRHHPLRRSKQRRPSHSASSHRRLHQKNPRRVHRRPRKPPRLRRRLHRRKVSASVQSAARPCLRTRRNSRSSSRARRSANNAWRRRDGFENDRPDPPDPRRFY